MLPARVRGKPTQALAKGQVWGPLHGVPYTLKDCHATAGMRSTAGFPPFADHVASEDGAVAARLNAAGGVLMGKTNVAMLLADYQSSNPIFGRPTIRGTSSVRRADRAAARRQPWPPE